MWDLQKYCSSITRCCYSIVTLYTDDVTLYINGVTSFRTIVPVPDLPGSGCGWTSNWQGGKGAILRMTELWHDELDDSLEHGPTGQLGNGSLAGARKLVLSYGEDLSEFNWSSKRKNRREIGNICESRKAGIDKEQSLLQLCLEVLNLKTFEVELKLLQQILAEHFVKLWFCLSTAQNFAEVVLAYWCSWRWKELVIPFRSWNFHEFSICRIVLILFSSYSK